MLIIIPPSNIHNSASPCRIRLKFSGSTPMVPDLDWSTRGPLKTRASWRTLSFVRSPAAAFPTTRGGKNGPSDAHNSATLFRIGLKISGPAPTVPSPRWLSGVAPRYDQLAHLGLHSLLRGRIFDRWVGGWGRKWYSPPSCWRLRSPRLILHGKTSLPIRNLMNNSLT